MTGQSASQAVECPNWDHQELEPTRPRANCGGDAATGPPPLRLSVVGAVTRPVDRDQTSVREEDSTLWETQDTIGIWGVVPSAL